MKNNDNDFNENNDNDDFDGNNEEESYGDVIDSDFAKKNPQLIEQLSHTENKSKQGGRFWASFLLSSGIIAVYLGVSGTINFNVSSSSFSVQFINASPGLVMICSSLFLFYIYRRDFNIKKQ